MSQEPRIKASQFSFERRHMQSMVRCSTNKATCDKVTKCSNNASSIALAGRPHMHHRASEGRIGCCCCLSYSAAGTAVHLVEIAASVLKLAAAMVHPESQTRGLSTVCKDKAQIG